MPPLRTRRLSVRCAVSPWPRAARLAGLSILAGTVLGLLTSATAIETGGSQAATAGEEVSEQGTHESGSVRVRVISDQSSGKKIRIVVDTDTSGTGAGAEVEVGASSDRDDDTVRGREHVEIDVGRGMRVDADDKVAFGHDIHVSSGDVIPGNLVCIFGSARVDGTVRGDVVVIGGDVEVGPGGLVRGEAIAIGGGGVKVAAGGVVEGEAVTVGGRVRLEDDALVGERIEISFIPSFGPRFGVSGLLWLGFLAHFFIVGLIGWILLSLSRGRCSTAAATLRVRGWESLLAGVGGAILYHIVVVPLLLLITVVLVAIVIGIPLVPVILLLMLIFPVPGYLVTATLLGMSASGTTGRLATGSAPGDLPPTHPVGVGRDYFLGHFFLSLPGLMSLLLALLVGGPGLVSKSFLLLSFAVISLAIALGWGAILLSRFGRRAPAAG